jgi:hypothetical protein
LTLQTKAQKAVTRKAKRASAPKKKKPARRASVTQSESDLTELSD